MRCSGSISVAADKHRSVRCLPACLPGSYRVLQGLAGLNGRTRGASADCSPGENSCCHAVISYQGAAPRSRFQLEEVATACQKEACVHVRVGALFLACLFGSYGFSLITESWMGLFTSDSYLTEILFSGQRGTFFSLGTTFQGSRHTSDQLCVASQTLPPPR